MEKPLSRPIPKMICLGRTDDLSFRRDSKIPDKIHRFQFRRFPVGEGKHQFMTPIPDASAMAEPVIPEKIREIKTLTWAVPPFRRPSRPLQNEKILSVTSLSLSTFAIKMNKGAASMVLDMGEPVRIYDFAQKLIDIYGDKDKNKIVITGLRPGEKLFEELLANKDNTIPTTNKRIFKAKVTGTLHKDNFDKLITTIDTDDPETLVEKLCQTIPEFTRKPCKNWKTFLTNP